MSSINNEIEKERLDHQEGSKESSSGKDELNLAEFPIALLTEKAPKGVRTLEFSDQIFDKGKVFYNTGKLYILKVMDHQEYDRNRWADDCGCHGPPPRKPTAAKKSPSPGAATSRGRKRGR